MMKNLRLYRHRESCVVMRLESNDFSFPTCEGRLGWGDTVLIKYPLFDSPPQVGEKILKVS